jgi:hypothetical protein
VGRDPAAVQNSNTGTFLSAMLEGVKPEIGEPCGFWMAVNPKYSAGFPWFVLCVQLMLVMVHILFPFVLSAQGRVLTRILACNAAFGATMQS